MAKKNVALTTNFAAESEATAKENAPSAAMLALFKPGGNALPANLKRRNLPQMVPPGEIPVDAIVSGEIIDVVDSPVSTVKGKLLWLRHESGAEFTFPCTGVIRNALAPGLSGKELDEALKKEIGKNFYAKRTLDKQSAKYKKAMFMFDVFTSTK